MAIQLLLKEVIIMLFVIHVVNRIIAHLFLIQKDNQRTYEPLAGV